MIQLNDVILIIVKIGPECVDFDIGEKKNLSVIINGTFNYFVHNSYADVLFFSVCCLIKDILLATADIDGLAISGMTDILTTILYFVNPLLFLFSGAEISFDNESVYKAFIEGESLSLDIETDKYIVSYGNNTISIYK